ncbi:virulence RhuM family protein [Aliarcobacter thereius]|uniref:Virulence RhuM family protein n=1 Tax=Aliarcobacter thereius TaxID=544718 RepID=A0A5R9H7N0_9BACT|nr:RhuM family protein [Aliarcobacter thereius]TLS71985.1 virulence RhuM family protein [Aliarcobacter thereius]TLT07245.1 virulence RhuM family protein [Aliarcobacter thereius]
MQDLSNLVVYNDGELELKVSVGKESVWLNRNQLAELFGRDVKTIGKHINNVFNENELTRVSTVAKFATVQIEGGREITRDVEYYNLDVIISIGYRVKSQKGVRFRQWATSVLKNYIQNGYAINHHKITEQRLFALENDMQFIKSKIKDNSLEFNQNIFFDGQIYDAYSFVNDLLKLAKKEVILIDNYIDDTVFTLFSKYPNINFTIYTSTISKQLKLDFEKYSKQYRNISLKTFKSSHDRFLIINKKEIYHLGASLKDLGKKWFAFSKMSLDFLNLDEILYKLEV